MRTKDFIYYASAAVLLAVTTQVAQADEVATQTPSVTEVDATATVELATEVDAVTVAVAASELCEAGDVDTAGALGFASSLVAAGAETVELGVTGKAASPPKISAAVAG